MGRQRASGRVNLSAFAVLKIPFCNDICYGSAILLSVVTLQSGHYCHSFYCWLGLYGSHTSRFPRFRFDLIRKKSNLPYPNFHL